MSACITFAVIAYLRRTRPAVLGLESAASLQRMSRRALAASMVVTSALLAGVVSGFASAHPDGLEWVSGDYSNQKYHRAAVENESATIAAVTDWQMRWSLSPEYSRREAALGEQPAAKPESTADSAAGPDASVNGWTSLAGLGGTALTLAVVIVAAWLLRRRKSLASSVVCETRGNCPAN